MTHNVMTKEQMSQAFQCPQCKKSDSTLYHNRLRYDHLGVVYKCNACELVFLYPRLSAEEQTMYYTAHYRNDYKDNAVEERFITDQHEGELRLNRILERFEGKGSLLEIGSGSGAFLSRADKIFDKVVGIELDVNARKFLNHKNISVYFDLNDIKDEKFDLIVMFHVLEHLLDPVAFLKNVSCYLKEKGSIIVEVPNVDDALVSFYNINEFKDFYFCTAHVSYFSMKTLGNCLMESGLKGDIFPVQRYNLNNHLHWLMHKKPGVLPEDQQIFSEETLKNYEKDLLSKNLSDTLWAVVEKNINIIGD